MKTFTFFLLVLVYIIVFSSFDRSIGAIPIGAEAMTTTDAWILQRTYGYFLCLSGNTGRKGHYPSFTRRPSARVAFDSANGYILILKRSAFSLFEKVLKAFLSLKELCD
jgi:hypothetical protein